ncbi:hypothetical protein FRX31_028000 [Thalictrum thalictroides]|uniref:Uncharacterized protein n=1 Tax=Thalictrum thalictroides TaxID=46969 RepID=A0A7J6VBE4_THATH|nr:hypothetical protein FRX31_028000 [Thalictrum thalictroides]
MAHGSELMAKYGICSLEKLYLRRMEEMNQERDAMGRNQEEPIKEELDKYVHSKSNCLGFQTPSKARDGGSEGMSSKDGSHDNEGEVPAKNHTSSTDGVKVSWSSILSRQAVSKKNLPFYAPTFVEGEQVIELEDARPSNNETTTRETRNSKGIENTNEEELIGSWETPSRKHTTRARTAAECRENGLNVVQGITQVIQQNEEPRYTDTDKAKGKAIATQGQQQGDGNGNKIEGFMKDARRSDTPCKDSKGNAKGNVSQHTQQYKSGT